MTNGWQRLLPWKLLEVGFHGFQLLHGCSRNGLHDFDLGNLHLQSQLITWVRSKSALFKLQKALSWLTKLDAMPFNSRFEQPVNLVWVNGDWSSEDEKGVSD